MCFSASASFVAGATLLGVGAATIRLTKRKTELPFAAIPLLFGLQQIIEGMIWLSFHGESPVSAESLTLIYSIFSHVVWPMFVPFAVILLETIPWRKKTLVACQLAGLTVGLYLLYFIVKFPVTAQVLGKHIVYESPHFYINEVMLLYLIATCASSFVSSHRIIRLFGALSLGSFALAYAIHAATMVSVWCFFAALLSVVVYAYFRGRGLPQERRFRASDVISLGAVKAHS